jgi:hypothetical protein
VTVATGRTFVQLDDGLLDLFIEHRVPRAGWLVYAAFERGRNLRNQLSIGDVARRCQLTLRNARAAAEKLVELGALDATPQGKGRTTIYEVAETLYSGAFWQTPLPRALAPPAQGNLPLPGAERVREQSSPTAAEAKRDQPSVAPVDSPQRVVRSRRQPALVACVAVCAALIHRWGEADGGQTLWLEFAGVPPAETRTFLKRQQWSSIPLGDGKYRWVAINNAQARAALESVNPTGSKHVTGIDEAASGWERRPDGAAQVSAEALAKAREREAGTARSRASCASNAEWLLLYRAATDRLPGRAVALFGQLYGVGWESDTGLLRVASADEMTCLMAEQYAPLLKSLGDEVFGRRIQLAIAFVPEIGSDKFVSIESLRAKDRRRA